MTKKSKNFSGENDRAEMPFFEQLKGACKGWFYMSETDAQIEPFYAEKAEAVTQETVLNATGNAGTVLIEEGDLDSFFTHLWLTGEGGPTHTPSGPIQNLRQFLEENLSDLKVFRIGRIRIDIYVVGRDRDGHVAGIKTRAVET